MSYEVNRTADLVFLKSICYNFFISLIILREVKALIKSITRDNIKYNYKMEDIFYWIVLIGIGIIIFAILKWAILFIF